MCRDADQPAVEMPSSELMTINNIFSILLKLFNDCIIVLHIFIVLILVFSPHTPSTRGLPLLYWLNQANPG